MAISAGFKQQCPSCETMVPVRDSGLIGRKIDCPKCKYRFLVEKPEGMEDDEEPKPKKSGKAKRAEPEDEGGEEAPKKKGLSSTVLVGAIIGVVGVLVVAF